VQLCAGFGWVARVVVAEGAVLCGQAQHAALGHGLDGVDEQVDDDLLQFLPVKAHGGAGVQGGLYVDAGLPQQVGHQHQAVLHGAVQV